MGKSKKKSPNGDHSKASAKPAAVEHRQVKDSKQEAIVAAKEEAIPARNVASYLAKLPSDEAREVAAKKLQAIRKKREAVVFYWRIERVVLVICIIAVLVKASLFYNEHISGREEAFVADVSEMYTASGGRFTVPLAYYILGPGDDVDAEIAFQESFGWLNRGIRYFRPRVNDTQRMCALAPRTPGVPLYLMSTDFLNLVPIWVACLYIVRFIWLHGVCPIIVNRIRFKSRFKREKFVLNLFFFSVYAANFAFGAYEVMQSKELMEQGFDSEVWEVCAYEGRRAMVYVQFLSLWFMMLVTILVEPRKKDFYVMIFHHMVTILLVYLSGFVSYRVVTGLVVQPSMDVADIILHFGKMLIYAGYGFIADFVFVLFVLVWIYSRHYLLPMVILYSWYVAFGLPQCQSGRRRW